MSNLTRLDVERQVEELLFGDAEYLSDRIKYELSAPIPPVYRIVMAEGKYPFLLVGDRLATADEIKTVFDCIKVNNNVAPDDTSSWLQYRMQADEKRKERARRERAEKKAAGPMERFGFVYMMGFAPAPFEHSKGVKIGWSTHPMRRALDIAGRGAFHERRSELVVLHAFPSTYVFQAERLVHKHFSHRRRGNTEWFDLCKADYRWFRAEAKSYVDERLPA